MMQLLQHCQRSPQSASGTSRTESDNKPGILYCNDGPLTANWDYQLTVGVDLTTRQQQQTTQERTVELSGLPAGWRLDVDENSNARVKIKGGRVWNVVKARFMPRRALAQQRSWSNLEAVYARPSLIQGLHPCDWFVLPLTDASGRGRQNERGGFPVTQG